MSKHHIIYIPGLGDHWDAGRSRALSLWRFLGVSAQLVPMQWYDGKAYEEKLSRVDAAVQTAIDKGYTVSVVGESAGASVALNYYVVHSKSLHRLVTICGVVAPTAAVSPKIYAISPGFKTSMSGLKKSVENLMDVTDVRILTAFYDPVVSHTHNIIDGAKHVKVPSLGHFTTIAACLTIYSWLVVRQIKK